MDPGFSCLNFTVEATVKQIVYLANKEYKEHPKTYYSVILLRIFNEKMGDLSLRLPALAYSAGVTRGIDFDNIEFSYGIDIKEKGNGYYSLESSPEKNYEIDYWVEISTIEPDPTYMPMMMRSPDPVFDYRSKTDGQQDFWEREKDRRKTWEHLEDDQQNENFGPEWLSYVPVIGSGRDAYRDFQNGDYGWAIFNGFMAVSDVFLVKSLFVAGGKIILKGGVKFTGSHTWGATKQYWKKKGIEELSGGAKHHWAISQKMMKRSPELLKFGNQPWNIIKFENQALHMSRAHGQNYRALQGSAFLERIYYGSPTWFQTSIIWGGGSIENYNR